MNTDALTRFARTLQLIGKEELDRLQAATVAVFGLGAVGSYVVESLARAGVGGLTSSKDRKSVV